MLMQSMILRMVNWLIQGDALTLEAKDSTVLWMELFDLPLMLAHRF